MVKCTTLLLSSLLVDCGKDNDIDANVRFRLPSMRSTWSSQLLKSSSLERLLHRLPICHPRHPPCSVPCSRLPYARNRWLLSLLLPGPKEGQRKASRIHLGDSGCCVRNLRDCVGHHLGEEMAHGEEDRHAWKIHEEQDCQGRGEGRSHERTAEVMR